MTDKGEKDMQVLTLVVNDDRKVDKLLAAVYDAGIRGGTILESTGMAHTLIDHDDGDDVNHFGALRRLTKPERAHSKTIFFVACEKDIQTIVDISFKILGNMEEPDTGFMFISEVTRAVGSNDSLKHE